MQLRPLYNITARMTGWLKKFLVSTIAYCVISFSVRVTKIWLTVVDPKLGVLYVRDLLFVRTLAVQGSYSLGQVVFILFFLSET